jgi:hypothetical protein
VDGQFDLTASTDCAPRLNSGHGSGPTGNLAA